MPRPGELGHETWLNDGWKSRSGVNVWGWYMTVDEAARHRLHADRRSRPANYWGGDRPGNNLFANSIVAVDADDRQIQVAFPDRASRSVGLGHAVAADARRHQAERQDDSRARVGRARPATCSSSIATTGKPVFGVEERAGAEGRRAGRVVFADAAVSAEAAGAARVEFNKDATW